MNNSTGNTAALKSDFQGFLKLMDDLVSEFERLLISELRCLETGQAEGLEAIAAAKQMIVDQLETHQHELISMFDQHSDRADVTELKKRFIQCRADNQSNNALVVLELKHANRSMEILRTVLEMDDLSLYGEHGEIRVKREQRRFGSA